MGMKIIEVPAAQYLPDELDTDAQYERVVADLTEVHQIFREKLVLRNKCWDFYNNIQWTKDEIDAHITQFRKPYVFNEIAHTVDNLVGTQLQTRLDAKTMPRERGDEAMSDILNFMVKWAEQMNQLEYIESEVFKEALIGGVGSSVNTWSDKDLEWGYPGVQSIPINEMRWDIHGKKVDQSDMRWMARLMIMSRMDATELLPSHADEIEKANAVANIIQMGMDSDTWDTYQQKVLSTMIQESGRKLIAVIEHYERVIGEKYVVADEIQAQNFPFDTYNDAKEFYDGMCLQYSKSGEILYNPDGSPRVALMSSTTNKIIQTVIVGDKVVEYNETALPDFPYTLNYAYFNNGDYRGFVEQLLDPQRLINTFFSQWEYQLGASTKSLMTVITSLMPRDWQDVEKVRSEVAKTGAVIPVMRHDAITVHPNIEVNRELFDGITFGIQRIMDYGGGRNAQGFQESAAESGRAVVARAEQAGLARLPLFDMLRLWRIQVTLKLIWYIKNFVTPGQTLRIIGIDNDVQFMEMDDQLLNTLREIKVDVVIDEATKSDSTKERTFQQMKELFSVLPGMPPEIVSKIMLEYSGIPASKKREIQDTIEFYKEYSMKKAEAQKQETLTQEVKDSLFKKMIRTQQEQAQQLDDQSQELKRKEKSVKTQLDDIEKLKQQVAEGNASPEQLMQASDKLQSPDELGGAQSAVIQGALTK
jgi:hypothetical protein